MRVEKYIDIINRILSEELDIIGEDKRNTVAERIAKELKIENYSILHLNDSREESSGRKMDCKDCPFAKKDEHKELYCGKPYLPSDVFRFYPNGDAPKCFLKEFDVKSAQAIIQKMKDEFEARHILEANHKIIQRLEEVVVSNIQEIPLIEWFDHEFVPVYSETFSYSQEKWVEELERSIVKSIKMLGYSPTENGYYTKKH